MAGIGVDDWHFASKVTDEVWDGLEDSVLGELLAEGLDVADGVGFDDW